MGTPLTDWFGKNLRIGTCFERAKLICYIAIIQYSGYVIARRLAG